MTLALFCTAQRVGKTGTRQGIGVPRLTSSRGSGPRVAMEGLEARTARVVCLHQLGNLSLSLVVQSARSSGWGLRSAPGKDRGSMGITMPRA